MDCGKKIFNFQGKKDLTCLYARVATSKHQQFPQCQILNSFAMKIQTLELPPLNYHLNPGLHNSIFDVNVQKHSSKFFYPLLVC